MFRQMYTDTEIKQRTGKDPQKLMTIATGLQDEAQSELASVCPQAIPKY